VDIRKNKSNTLHKQISLPWQNLKVIEQDKENDKPITVPEIIQELSHLSLLLKREGAQE
jgi:hypothetical protein